MKSLLTNKSEIVVCIALGIILTFTAGFTGCAWLQSSQGQAVLATANGIANVAKASLPSKYAGDVQLVQDGVNSIATVMQAMKGLTVSQALIANSAGIVQVGQAIAPLINSKVPITQADVDKVFAAAAIAGAQK